MKFHIFLFFAIISDALSQHTSFALGKDYYLLNDTLKKFAFRRAEINERAVVKVGGCSGAFVSRYGLVITNYHCIKGRLPDSIILKGYNAEQLQKEFPLLGLTIREVFGYYEIPEEVANKSPQDIMAFVEKKWGIVIYMDTSSKKTFITSDKKLAEIVKYQNGRYVFLTIFDTLNDVRLVFAPPHSIGNFGGEEDNWEWPRHSADFSFIRVYKENLPYRPRNFLRMADYLPQEGDTVFVVGFPGKTSLYLSSFTIEKIAKKQLYPIAYALKPIFDAYKRWILINKSLPPNPYYSHYSSLGNYYKNINAKAYEIYPNYELSFPLDSISRYFFLEALFRYIPFSLKCFLEMKIYAEKMDSIFEKYKSTLNISLEKELIKSFCASLKLLDVEIDTINLIKNVWNFKKGKKRKIFRFTRKSPEINQIFNVYLELVTLKESVSQFEKEVSNEETTTYSPLLGFPNANGTRRISTGKIIGMDGNDGIFFKPFTTLEGMIKKCSNENPEFFCDTQLLNNWKKSKNNVVINFIASAHTTGGNSGSPVLDVNGKIIGINFDRCLKSTVCDYKYNPLKCRNIVTSSYFIKYLLREIFNTQNILFELEW